MHIILECGMSQCLNVCGAAHGKSKPAICDFHSQGSQSEFRSRR